MEEKQLFQRMNSGYGTFFPNSVRTTLDFSSSLLLNLFRLFSYFSLIKLVSGNNSPNSFTFIQNTTYYLLKTSGALIPGATEQGFVATLKAYKSIVNSLIDGELGPITQYGNSSIHTHSIWSTEACKASIGLESNDSESAVASFLNDFVTMVKNDSAFIEAKKLCADMVFDLELGAIVFGSIIVILVIAMAVFIFCIPPQRIRSGDYESIGEGSMAMRETIDTTSLGPSYFIPF